MALHSQDDGSSMMLAFPHSQVDKVTVRRFQHCLPIGATKTGHLCILVKGAMMPMHADYQATSKVLLVGVGAQEATSKVLLVGVGTQVTILCMVLLVISKSGRPQPDILAQGHGWLTERSTTPTIVEIARKKTH